MARRAARLVVLAGAALGAAIGAAPPGGVLPAVVLPVVALAPLGGCLGCRDVAVTPLDLDCSPASPFRGELHFTDADAWRSFLTDRCLTPDDPSVDTRVDAVDFTTQAVVVARNLRDVGGRCLEQRQVEAVSACEDGVRVVFDDVESGELPCPGDWTVAFALPRSELRAALGLENTSPAF